MTTIIVTSHGTACPVAPVPDTPRVEREIKAEWQRKSAVSLAKIKQNPVPKGAMK